MVKYQSFSKCITSSVLRWSLLSYALIRNNKSISSTSNSKAVIWEKTMLTHPQITSSARTKVETISCWIQLRSKHKILETY